MSSFHPSRLFSIIQTEDPMFWEEPTRSISYPIREYHNPLTPPDICPRCGTKTHAEGDMVYCQSRHHSWAIPIPDAPFDYAKANDEDAKNYKHAPGVTRYKLRQLVCARCGKLFDGHFIHNRKYCSAKCYHENRKELLEKRRVRA